MEQTGPFYKADECCNPLCCKVFKVCDCECLSCVADYIEYVKNRVQREHLGITADEVEAASAHLIDLAFKGTYWRILDEKVSEEPLNTFGRSYIYSQITHYNVKPDVFRVKFRETLRILDIEKFDAGKEPCGCCEKQQCEVVTELFKTMRTFIERPAGQPLNEWHMALCGVCYEQCGENVVFRYAA